MGIALRRSRLTIVIVVVVTLIVEAVAAPASAGSAPAPFDGPAVEDPAPLEVPAPPDEQNPDPAATRQERVDLRTEASRTFDNADGTFTSELFSFPIHYRPDAQEEWLPIEVAFRASDESDVVATSDRAPVAVSVGSNKAATGFLSVATDAHRIAFSLPSDSLLGLATSTPTFDEHVATWDGFLPGVDLRVLAGARGAKSFLVLERQPLLPSWTFLIHAPGLEAGLEEDGSVIFRDPGGEPVGRIPQPYAVDSSASEERGGGEMTDQVALSLAKIGGVTALTISVDARWLAKATYPVYVDPTVTPLIIGTSSSYGDAFVSSKYPTMNFADYVRPDSPYYHEHWLGQDPTNSSNVNKVLMRFDTSVVSNATIDLAKLDVFPYHQYYNAPTATTTWLNRITTSWTESGVTWNTDAGSSALTSASLVEGSTGYFTITGLVQDWADGTYTNYGVKLHENGNNGTYWKRLISSEQGGTMGTNVPHLVVTWHRPVGTPSDPTAGEWTKNRALTWTYSDEDGAAQSHYEVQVDNNSDFSSPVSQSGVVASSSKTWSIPTTVSLSNGATYYWRVKVKNGTGWSSWKSASFKWDAADPTFTSLSVTGEVTKEGSVYYQTGSGSFTVKLRGKDVNSGVDQTYLALLHPSYDDLTVMHDWSVGGTNCTDVNASTQADVTACSQSHNSGGEREVTFTVSGTNVNSAFDVHHALRDTVGNRLPDSSYTPHHARSHFRCHRADGLD